MGLGEFPKEFLWLRPNWLSGFLGGGNGERHLGAGGGQNGRVILRREPRRRRVAGGLKHPPLLEKVRQLHLVCGLVAGLF